MPRLNSCPIDGQQIEFFGISHHRTGVMLVDPDTGDEYPEVERFHWSRCTQNENHMVKADFDGKKLAVRPPFSKDELKAMFPSSREA
jgi:hypothetical protein